MSGVPCVAVFRRPEGKFKKKQNPHDEALQILRPQMDNPPAPQVDAHTSENIAIQTRSLMLNAFAKQVSNSFVFV